GNLLDAYGNAISFAQVTADKLQQALGLRDAQGSVLPWAEVTDETLRQALCDTSRQPEKDLPVHLKDIHLEKGMHCIDCHFAQDNHGNGKLYGEYVNAIQISCIDCHGTIEQRASLRTSGPASPPGGTSLRNGLTPWNGRRFEWRGEKLYQRSMMEKGKEWEVVQVADTVDPNSDWARAHPRQ